MPATVGYLLDTNILVALLRGKALGQRIDSAYVLKSNLNQCIVCVVSVGEMYSLVHKFRWGSVKVQALRDLLDELVWVDINRTEILEAYGEIDHAMEAAGTPMGKNDVWIAATARATGFTLLTTDRDFDRLDPTWIRRIWIDPNVGKP
jgi:predicted nucleic acid-binding protein